jgi:two-component system sensor histidine kinase EvgS
MDKEILDQIFEPFFTTKPHGKGTGLGLAMVYGVVKQNGGFINVYSEPSKGTTFHIYIPRQVGKADKVRQHRTAKIPCGHGETILVVEDEVSILKLTRKMLEELGYAVLTAGRPCDAMQLADARVGKIHLLITDVVMPEMNGKALAERLRGLYPALKCLFMSGYTANVIAHHGILDEGVHFIQKPVSMTDLAAKVREALGTSDRTGAEENDG